MTAQRYATAEELTLEQFMAREYDMIVKNATERANGYGFDGSYTGTVSCDQCGVAGGNHCPVCTTA
jgi:hypothetical protein